MENIQRKLLGIGLSILAVGFIGTALAFTAAYETALEAEAAGLAESPRATCPTGRKMYLPVEESRGEADSTPPDATAAGDTPETAGTAPGGDAKVGNPQLKQTNR